MISQLWHLLLLAGVASAPLPIIVYALTQSDGRPAQPMRLHHAALSVLALWVLIESLIVVSLGWLGRLWLPELVLVEGTILVAGLGLAARDRGRAGGRFLCEAAHNLSALGRRPAAERWLLALVGGLALLMVIEGLSIPTKEYDSLAYQLPRVAHWYQRGTFRVPVRQWEGELIDSYPYDWNALFFLMVRPVGHDQFVTVVNLAAWSMLGLAVYGLARLAGSHPAGGLLAAALLLFMPVGVVNVHSAHVDLAFGALFLASVYFSLQARQSRQPLSALMAVGCAGMMLGTKLSALGYAALLGGLWVWLVTWDRLDATRRGLGKQTARPHWLVGLVAVASVGLLGGSWYVRNALVLGNPLGYVKVSILGRTIWDGVITRSFIEQTSLAHNFRVSNPEHWAILWRALRRFAGPSGLALAIGGLSSLSGLSRRPQVRPVLLALIALGAASLYLFVAGPWSAKQPYDPDISDWMGQQLRYTFAFWGLLAALAGTTMTGAPPPRLAWAGPFFATAAAADAVRQSAPLIGVRAHRPLIVFASAAVLLFLVAGTATHPRLTLVCSRLLAWCRRRRPALISIAAASCVTLAALSTAVTLVALRIRHEIQDSWYGGISRYVDDVLPPHLRVGFLASHKSYLLYGKRLDRAVQYVRLDPRSSPEEKVARVRREPVDVLAVGPWEPPSPLLDWLTDSGGAFERVHGEDVRHEVVVYRVIP